jgi:hypothetical protein
MNLPEATRGGTAAWSCLGASRITSGRSAELCSRPACYSPCTIFRADITGAAITQSVKRLWSGLDDQRPGIRFPVGERDVYILCNIQTSSRAKPSSYTMGTGAFSLTTYVYLLPKLRIVEHCTIPSNAFMAKRRDNVVVSSRSYRNASTRENWK